MKIQIDKVHIKHSKISKVLLYPIIQIADSFGKHFPKSYMKVRYLIRFRKRINLKKPQNLNEKIQWLLFNTDTSEWSRLSDKYAVRGYVKECGLEDTLVELYGKWDKTEHLNFDQLPRSFILKSNNGSGAIIVVKDKSMLNLDTIKRELNKWLNVSNFGYEKHYRSIKTSIIAEELLPIEKGSKSIVDYKIWCFNGKVHYFWVCTNRDSKGTDVMTYDLDWNPHPEYSIFDSRYRRGSIMEKPKNLKYMIEVAEKLSKPFPVVRVDLYNIKGRIYFGEMTFTSLGGMMNFYTKEFLLKMGNQIEL